jgi:hypothetical protein
MAGVGCEGGVGHFLGFWHLLVLGVVGGSLAETDSDTDRHW